MKVLMSADRVGGVSTYAAELAGALRERGVEVAVATIDERRFRLEWMDDPWDDVAASGAWLLELEERERPDVVHVNGYAHGALPWRAPCVVVAHSDVCSWFRAVRGIEAPPEWDRYREEVAAGLRAADAVVAISAAVAADVRARFGVEARVIHNGSAQPASSAPKEPFVLGAGRLWDEAKNLAALDAAAARLAWPVVVAGELGGARAAHARATGRLSPPELAGLRRRAAIFCAPARYEPFGLAILEAARDRCALVLGDVPSLRELWDGAALFTDPGDPLPALERLIDDPAERERLAAAAQERSLRYPVPAAEHEALYASLATAVPA